MANNLLVNGHTPLPGRQQPSPLVIKSRKSNFIMACLTHPFKSCQIRSTHRLNGRCWVFYCIKNKIIFVERTYFLSIQRSYSLHQSIPTSKLFFSFFIFQSSREILVKNSIMQWAELLLPHTFMIWNKLIETEFKST